MRDRLPSRIPKRWRWFAALAGVTLVGCLVAFLFRAPVLGWFATAWEGEQWSGRVDAVVINAATRDAVVDEAVDWIGRGQARELVVLVPKLLPTDELGITSSATNHVARVATSRGVPPDRIHWVGENLNELPKETAALVAWLPGSGMTRVCVLTDPFRTRRWRQWLHRAGVPDGVLVKVRSVDHPEFTLKDWWQKEAGLIAFQNEWIHTLRDLIQGPPPTHR